MKYFSALFQFLLFGAAIAFSFYCLQPSTSSTYKNTGFSTENAMHHVEQISKKPHFTGSAEHAIVRNYLISELENLGLEPHVQQGFSTTYSYGLNIAIPENILAKIDGKNPDAPALLIMTHYDSVAHSSYGAADAGSGLATILESINVFLSQGQTPENDIIILFSDTEEVGLNGANLFVKEHPWAEQVGLVLNFEARGSAGPSSMILEVNGGNKHLISHFAKADISNPFANSLMYSVYKLLPNDTDSTVFREEANIPSYFFAFIDHHYNYHTALDTVENLDVSSLNQQGEYAVRLLTYFSNTDLNQLTSARDHVYFNFPVVGLLHFPLGLALILIVFGFLSLLVLTYIGIKKDKIHIKEMIKSLFYAIVALLFSFLIGYYGWKCIAYFYPEYKLILQGFPYNGLSYIIAFVSLSLFFLFRFFDYFKYKTSVMSFMPVAIFIWLLISFLAYLYLPGASYLVIPALFGLVILVYLVVFKINNQLLHFICSLPALFLVVPFVHFFPVGLGISAIFISCVLCSLILLIISPLLFNFKSLKGIAFILFCTSLFFFGKAHINADFSPNQPRPSSLVYYQDSDNGNSFWASYDAELSNWNAPYFTQQSDAEMQFNFESKYSSRFKHIAEATSIYLPISRVDVEELSTSTNTKTFKLNLIPERELNRYELFFNKPLLYTDVKVNGKAIDIDLEKEFKQRNSRFLNYYVTNQEALEIEFTVHTAEAFEIKVYESAFDLLSRPDLEVSQRPNSEIPMPFVLNDASISAYTIPFL